MHSNVRQTRLRKKTGKKIADAMVAQTGRYFAALGTQPELKTAHDQLDWLALGERTEIHAAPQIIWLYADEQPARPQNAKHLAQRVCWPLQVHQHGLAGDHVERVVRERNRRPVALDKRKQALRNMGKSTAECFFRLLH